MEGYPVIPTTTNEYAVRSFRYIYRKGSCLSYKVTGYSHFLSLCIKSNSYIALLSQGKLDIVCTVDIL